MSKKLTAEETVIVELECLREDVENISGFDHYEDQDESLLRTKMATTIMDNCDFRFIHVKRVSAQSRLKAIAEEVEGKIKKQEKEKDKYENDSLDGHMYISAMDKETAFREVLQIIQQHLQDDNPD